MRSKAEETVIGLFRRKALRGSSRPIRLEESVGPGGLGLDSLAMVDFVVTLEKETGVTVPDSTWARLGEITPGYFVRLLEDHAGAPAPPIPDRKGPNLWSRFGRNLRRPNDRP